MTAFSRTAPGIANYRLFHRSDYTVFIEGKRSGPSEDVRSADVFYYEYLLTAATPGKRAKVKCVGNKDAAFEYARRIREGGVAKSVVIVDKDLEGVTSSALAIFPVIRTFGYSWENELWTTQTVLAILEDLTNARVEVEPEVATCLPRLARRLKYLSLLDAGRQVSGESILRKRTALGGLAYSYPVVRAAEVRRVAREFHRSPSAECKVARQIVSDAWLFDPREVIQGHIWHHMVLRFTAELYSRVNHDRGPSNSLMTQLALSHLRRNAADAVGADLVARYAAELARLGI